MNSITVGEIAAFIALLAGLITGLGIISRLVGKAASQWLSRSLEPISAKLDTIDTRFNSFDMDRCKDYLVAFIGKIDRGYSPSDTEIERFFENYDRYQELGGNSYVKTEVERLKKSGLLRKS